MFRLELEKSRGKTHTDTHRETLVKKNFVRELLYHKRYLLTMLQRVGEIQFIILLLKNLVILIYNIGVGVPV